MPATSGASETTRQIIPEIVRIAAVADIHCSRTSEGALQPLFAQIAEQADVLLLCGDLCDYGLPEEAHILVRELDPVLNGTSGRSLPTVAVLGNHDFESGKQHELSQIFADAGVHMLDGEAVEILGVGFAGVKGFAGGFGSHTLGAWGESAIKSFVKEAMDEQIKLECALARLRSPQRIAILHYSPIRDTVVGEPVEIFPFLGTTRLEEPLNRYNVTVAVHGHAHRGSPSGRTSTGIPVYNVSLPLLRAHFPARPPFRLLEVHTGYTTQTGTQTGTQTETETEREPLALEQIDVAPATRKV
ncbi:MAG TPA: metallophosphoesterase [Ktedonobacterales bacterium]